MTGTLFVVATPIGNLEDLSFRALRTLKEVDVIAAEDTRRTAKLLAHYEIRRSMVSLHEHNERRETPRLIARLQAGDSIALVSDAGTPGISDPGAHLVRAARGHGIPVSPIPGPSAITAALSTSGVTADEFVFLGFPPRSGGARTKWFQRLAQQPTTAVFFEAPHRIAQTVTELGTVLVDRPIHVHRELTKIHETYVITPKHESGSAVEARGEFVVVVEKSPIKSAVSGPSDGELARAVALIGCLTTECSYEYDEAEGLVSAVLSLDRRTIRKAAKKARIARRRLDESLS